MGDRGGGGGSTITQQLAKNVYGRQQYAYFTILITKLREMLIASELEELYSKEDILELYLNTVPFGENIFGVEAASQRFFQKSAKSLNIQEAATIVGMLKATTYYNPKNHPDRSFGRRNVVLGLMASNGFFGIEELDSLTALPLQINYKREDQNDGAAPYFREYVRQHLKELLPKIADSLGRSYNLYTDGLKIYTTLDSRLQNYAEKAVNRHMRDLQNSFDDHWKGRKKTWENDDKILETILQQSPAYQALKESGVPADSIEILIRQKRDMEIYSWKGKEAVQMSTMDSLLFYLNFLNTGVLSVEPASGQIKAWVGGINYRFFKYDHVNKNSKRQVGSIFKPIVYASALEQNISPCSYIDAEQKKFVENEEEWQPANADNNYEGKYSFEGALTESVNTVSVKVLEQAGIKTTVRLAHDLGIDSHIPEVPSIALGTPSISLTEMVHAFCVFPNQGKKVTPYFITKIENNDGQVIWEHPNSKPQQVLTSNTSQMMIEMLKTVVNKGTGIRLRNTYKLPNDIAGKTGTTQSNADGWFMAITPKLVTGVWVGGEYPSIHFRTTALGQGANMALPIYALYQQQINNDSKFRNIASAKFPNPPASILRELDCDPFKEDVNFWESLFGTKEERDARREERKTYSKKPVPQKKEKGFFKGLKRLFKKAE
jgi:penicillin-binding protein 1A